MLFAPGETGTTYEFFYDELRKDLANQVGVDENEQGMVIENNILRFSDNSNKFIEVIDLHGRKVESSQATTSYTIKNKGMLIISVTYPSGKNNFFKYLNL